jgi:integrase
MTAIFHKARGRDVTKRGEAPITRPNARAKLAARGKPYFRLVQAGLHVGYRRNKNSAATWLARRALGEDRYEFQPLDIADPEGEHAYYEAVRLAQRWFKAASLSGSSSITVRDAVEAYRVIRETRTAAQRGSFTAKHTFRSSMNRVLASSLADIELNRLTRADLKAWRSSLATSMLQRGDAQIPLSVSTARRITNDFAAALNHAVREHEQITLSPQVISFGLRGDKSEVLRNSRPPQVLLEAEVKAIVAAAREVDAEGEWGGDLYRLVLVLAATGARFSQIQRLTVGDVDVTRSRINVPVSHKGRGSKATSHTAVPLPDEVIAALTPVINGRHGTDYLLERRQIESVEGQVGEWVANGRRGPWQSPGELGESRWPAILKKAGLKADLVPYCLRHSSIVAWLVDRFPTRYVAQLHDTSSKMIEQHYARFVTDAFDDLASARVKAKSFGGAEIVPLQVAA